MPSGIYNRKSRTTQSDQPIAPNAAHVPSIRRVTVSEATHTYLSGLSGVTGLTGSQIVELVLQDKSKIKEQHQYSALLAMLAA